MPETNSLIWMHAHVLFIDLDVPIATFNTNFVLDISPDKDTRIASPTLNAMDLKTLPPRGVACSFQYNSSFRLPFPLLFSKYFRYKSGFSYQPHILPLVNIFKRSQSRNNVSLPTIPLTGGHQLLW